ncbi:MAG TPA: hypothetical protein DDY91_17775 [Planctomycetaceae bacterium]|nr:hypothetical protein [Planctomycetaceae bacterium]
MSTIRLRRLAADHQKLREYTDRHPRLELLAADGDPPERYVIEYKIRSLRQVGEELREVSRHQVEIVLPRDYPRMAPQCRMLTPVFHPNIAPHAICVGDHWSAGEPIWGLVARIGEMLAWQSYNVKSPLNGEAARWAEQNRDDLPLDPVSLLVDLAPSATTAPTPRTSDARISASPEPESRPTQRQSPLDPQASWDAVPKTARPAPPVTPTPTPADPAADLGLAIQCPQCQEKYRVAASLAGKRVRCRKCQAILQIPASGDGA